MIDHTNWLEFKIGDLFECKLSKGDLKEQECDIGSVNLISSGSSNNGVVKIIDERGDGKAEIFEGNCLTLDMFCNCFYQEERFYAVSHGRVNILMPKFNLTRQIGLFLATIINAEQYKFSYGRAVYSSVVKDLNIKLPATDQGVPDWEFMNNYIDGMMSKIKVGKISIMNCLISHKTDTYENVYTTNWQEFTFDEIFEIKKGSRLTSADMEQGNINYIGAISENNGVREKIGNGIKYEGNCITVNYNGSVGEAFYQYEPFWASDDVNILFLKNMKLNKYIGMFLCTLIKMEKFKYSYGRKWNVDQMKKSYLQLPVKKNGEPDWQFMENYIKLLPYSDRI